MICVQKSNCDDSFSSHEGHMSIPHSPIPHIDSLVLHLLQNFCIPAIPSSLLFRKTPPAAKGFHANQQSLPYRPFVLLDGATRLEAIVTRLEAIATRLEARLEAIATRLEAILL